jgi:hypothetical protein
MNSFNSLKNGSSIVNPRVMFKIIEVSNDIYVLGSYRDVLNIYNSNGSGFSPSFSFTGGDSEIFIAKYSNTGTVTWISRINRGSLGTEYPVNMILDSDNNIYILGSYTRELRLYNNDGNQSIPSLTNVAGNDMFLAKYNSNGSGIWVTQISMNIIPSLTNVAEFSITNIGENWNEITSIENKNWISVAISSDGQYQTAVEDAGYIYVSSNYGVNWSEITSVETKYWGSVSISSDGKYQTAVIIGGDIYTSSNYGVNWNGIPNTGNYWFSVSMSSDGEYQTAVINNDGTIFTSSNYGVNWVVRTTAGNKNWLSVSVSSSGLFQTAVVNDGTIYTSSDYGVNWNERNAIVGNKRWFSVSISSTGQYQTAVVNNGTISTSSNYGTNWTQTTAVNKEWVSVSISYTGQFQIAAVANQTIYISSDYGVNWVEKTSSGNKSWRSVSISSTGVYQTAVADGATGSINTSVATSKSSSYTIQPVNLSLDSMNNIYISGRYSTDITLYNSTYIANPTFVTLSNVFGNHIFIAKYNRDGSGLWAMKNNIVENTWISTNSDSVQWNGIAMSSNGQYQTAVVLGGRIYVSNDFGNNWTQKMTDASRAWYGIAMSSTGQYQTATDTYGGYIYVSTDTGNTWTSKDTTRNWREVAMSSNGKYQTVTVEYGQIYVSSDFGNNWTAKDTTRIWQGVAMSSTGQYQTATVSSDYIYVSTDTGNTWTAKEQSRNWKLNTMSSSGQYQIATIGSGPLYISSDTGNTWTTRLTDSNRVYNGIAMSSTGQYQTAVENYFHYISIDYGNTWSSYYVPTQRFRIAMSSTGQYQTTLIRGNKIVKLSRKIPSTNLVLSLDIGNNVYFSGSYNTGLTFYNKNNSIFHKSTGGNDVFVVKYNSDGSGVWTMRREGPTDEIPQKLLFDSGNNMYILGSYNRVLIDLFNSTYMSRQTFRQLINAGNTDIFVAKYTSDGSGLWATRISSIQNDIPVNLAFDSENNVYISGTYNKSLVFYNGTDRGSNVSTFTSLSNIGTMNTTTFVAKYNSDGSGLWATQFGTENIIDVSTFGTTWVGITAAGNKTWASISLSSTGQYQTAVAYDNYINTSSNYGVNWSERTAAGNKGWVSISLSSTGQYQTAVVFYGKISRSSNYGVNWVEITSIGDQTWLSISLSSTGQYQAAAGQYNVTQNYIITSSDYGVNWVERTSTGIRDWRSVSLSSDGKYQIAGCGAITTAQGTTGGTIFTSSNYGVNWVERTSSGIKSWVSISLSSTGQYQTAAARSINISSDYGVNWVEITSTRGVIWKSVSVSSSGQYQTIVKSSSIHMSSNYGINWFQITVSGTNGTNNWNSISLSSDGMYLTAVPGYGLIYTSKNNIMIMSIVKPINLSIDSGNNLYISGTQNTPFALYNSTDTIASTFKTLTNRGNIDTFIAKYNSDGIGMWATQISDTSFNNPLNLVLDSANDIYISGTYGSELTLYNSKDTSISTTFKTLENSGGANTFITKYNKYGTGLWATRIDGNNSPSNYINNLMLSK